MVSYLEEQSTFVMQSPNSIDAYKAQLAFDGLANIQKGIEKAGEHDKTNDVGSQFSSRRVGMLGSP